MALPSAADVTVPAALTEAEYRQLMVMDWLQQSRTRTEAVACAVMQWGVSRRSAQLYVQRAIRRLTREAAQENRGFFLRLSQLQRDRLLQQVIAAAEGRKDLDAAAMKALAQLVDAGCKLLDSRDRTAEAMHSWMEVHLADENAGPAPVPGLPLTRLNGVLPTEVEPSSPQTDGCTLQALEAMSPQPAVEEAEADAALEDMTEEELRAGLSPEELEEADLMSEVELDFEEIKRKDPARFFALGREFRRQEEAREARRRLRCASVSHRPSGVENERKALLSNGKGLSTTDAEIEATLARACAFLRENAPLVGGREENLKKSGASP